MQKPIVILDAKGSLMHSVFSGVDREPVLNSVGEKINSATHGITVWLERYIADALTFTSPMNIIAVWDGGNEYRKRLYPEYKKKRHEREKEPVLEAQLKLAYDAAKRIIAYSGGINMVVDTVEADDVIALLAQKITDRPVVIFTRDADLLSLSNDNVSVRQCDKWSEDYKGVPFKYVTIFKALCGDSSDEYGGVPQVGPKAFEHLVAKYGYDGLDELESWLRADDKATLLDILKSDPDKVLQKIADNWGSARLCLRLAALHPQLCWGFIGKKQIKPQFYTRLPSGEKLQAVMQKVRCGHLYETYFQQFEPRFRLVTEDNFDASIDFMNEKLLETSVVAFDHETRDSLKHPGFVNALPKQRRSAGYVDVLSQKLTGTSFCFGDNNQYTFYFSFNHKDTKNIDKQWCAKICEGIVDENIPLVAHNANFEEQVLKQDCGYVLPWLYDTRIMSTYVDEDREHHLKELSFETFGYTQTEYKELLAACGAVDMTEITGEQVLNYGCDDSFVTAHLFKQFWLTMVMEGSWDFYAQNDVLTTPVLNRSFETGAAIDFEELERQHKRDLKTIDEGRVTVRAALEEHCKEPKPAAANALFAQEKDYLAVGLREGKDGLNPRQVLARLEEKRLLLIEASVYRPYSRTEAAPEFLATPTQLTAVAERIGIATPITTVSTSGIAKWIASVAESLLPPLQLEFINLLAEAAHEVKKREGAFYDKLHAFCSAHNPATPKVIETGDELNLDSPKQMTELLYCKLGLPVREYTRPQKGSTRALHALEGSPSTNELAIEMAIAEDCPEGDWRREFLRLVIAIKAASTRCELYWNPYPWWKHPRDGAIHGGIKNCGTVTRRPSGSSPNFLQVDAAGETRRIFIPRYTGQIIVTLDFNGQELRATGSESRDPVLIECYTGLGTYVDEDGMTRTNLRDVHSVTGSGFARTILARTMDRGLLNSLPFDSNGVMDYDFFRGAAKGNDQYLKDFAEVRDVLVADITTIRQMAKVVNFLLIYGGTAFTMAAKLGVPEAFAEELMALVFSRYPRLQPWQEETIAFGARWGYVETVYGTRRHLTEDIVSSDRSARNRMGRQAVNYKIQAVCAEILKIVLTGVHETRLFEETKSSMLAPVYDEITASVPIDSVFEYCQRLQDLMNVCPPTHAIPMLAECSLGRNWGELIELGDRPSERKITATIEKLFKEKTT